MSRFSQKLTQLGAGLLVGSSAGATSLPEPGAHELVDALNGVFGKHAGARASHAKGLCVRGEFAPDAQALRVTKGGLWGQKSLSVMARFSVGGGNPMASDKGKTVRGLALRVGDQWDLVMLSAPVFMVATAQEFVDFMAARRPDPATGKPDPARVKAFNEATPSTKAQIAYLEKTPVPASYAQTPYWGINSFVFTNAQNQAVHGRWRLEPQAGRQGLSGDELAKAADDFLQPELKQRLAQGPVVFDLWLQLAQPGDDVNNPSIAWPSTNPELHMGQLRIHTLDSGCENTMFNPATLPQGIALSEDPTLQVRAGAYAVSLGRRRAP